MQFPTQHTLLLLSIRPLTSLDPAAPETDGRSGFDGSYAGSTSRIWHRPFWLWPPSNPAAKPTNGAAASSQLHQMPAPPSPVALPAQAANGGGKASRELPHQISILLSTPDHPRLLSLEGVGPSPELDPELGIPVPFEFYIYDGVLNLGAHHMQLAARMIACVHPMDLDNLGPDGEFELRLSLVHPEVGPVFDHLGPFQILVPEYAIGG